MLKGLVLSGGYTDNTSDACDQRPMVVLGHVAAEDVGSHEVGQAVVPGHSWRCSVIVL